MNKSLKIVLTIFQVTAMLAGSLPLGLLVGLIAYMFGIYIEADIAAICIFICGMIAHIIIDLNKKRKKDGMFE